MTFVVRGETAWFRARPSPPNNSSPWLRLGGSQLLAPNHLLGAFLAESIKRAHAVLAFLLSRARPLPTSADDPETTLQLLLLQLRGC
jgi:hypothetical protein